MVLVSSSHPDRGGRRTAMSTRTGQAHQRGQVEEWNVLQRTLPHTAASVRLARVTTRVACRAWRVPAVEETAVLVASELTTAALEHAGPGPLTLRVRMTPRRFRLELHDPSGLLPPGLADPVDEPSPSAAVLDASTTRWGVELRHPGAELWAELAL
jgi:serine/threonine-protein kinase RsbW